MYGKPVRVGPGVTRGADVVRTGNQRANRWNIDQTTGPYTRGSLVLWSPHFSAPTACSTLKGVVGPGSSRSTPSHGEHVISPGPLAEVANAPNTIVTAAAHSRIFGAKTTRISLSLSVFLCLCVSLYVFLCLCASLSVFLCVCVSV